MSNRASHNRASHVPQVARSRPSHQFRERGTHGPDGSMAIVSNAASVQEQLNIDAVYGEQNIIDRAISSAKLAAALTIEDLRNSPANVYWDDAGLHVEDGAVFIQDEWGLTVLGASGFDGSWNDAVLTGIKNGSFSDNATASPATEGRNSHIPYWTTVYGNGGSANVAPGYVTMLTLSAGDWVTLTSDNIRVRSGATYGVIVVARVPSMAADTATMIVSANGYAADGTFLSTDVIDSRVLTGGSGSPDALFVGSFDTSVGGFTAATNSVKLTIEAQYGSGLTSGVEVYEVALFELIRPRGTVFPSSPSFGHRFFHETHNLWFYYDGTRWVSETLFVTPLPQIDNLAATSTDVYRVPCPSPWGTNAWLEDLVVSGFHVTAGTALSGSHRWSYNLRSLDTSAALTALATFDINSGASATWRLGAATAIDALLGTNKVALTLSVVKTGTPGNLYIYGYVTYRIVAA